MTLRSSRPRRLATFIDGSGYPGLAPPAEMPNCTPFCPPIISTRPAFAEWTKRATKSVMAGFKKAEYDRLLKALVEIIAAKEVTYA